MRRLSRADEPNYPLRRASAVLLLAAVALLFWAIAGRPSDPPKPATAQGPARAGTRSQAGQASRPGRASTGRPSGPFAVGTSQIAVTEPAGSTAASAGSQPGRRLPIVVRYPALGSAGGADRPGAPAQAAGGPFPLVVFSQGFDIRAEAYAALLDAWARAGYVVAAPTYPFTDPVAQGGPQESDIVNHPGDLRFVISTLLSQAHNPSSPLHDLLRADAVALIGHSDGGDVSLAVAANTCCRDPVVKAAVILSGAELSSFGGSYFGSGSVPLLVIQGTADTVNPPGCSVALYNQAPAPKYYVALPGEQHEPPYLDPGQTRSQVAQAVIDFLDGYLKRQPLGLVRLSRTANAAGISTITSAPTLPGASTYCP